VKKHLKLSLKKFSASINTWGYAFEDEIITTDPKHPTHQDDKIKSKRLTDGLLETDDEILDWNS
jgi:hypothetical protein